MSNAILNNKQTMIAKKKENALIHKALLYMAINFGCYELEIKFEELARACDVSIDNFTQKFHNLESLLQVAIERMKILFIRHVRDPVLNSPFKNKKIIWHFLRCVRYYFKLYPEAGFIFTLSFFSNIIVSNIYNDIEDHFELWRDTLLNVLQAVTHESQAKILTETYLVSLRGQLQLSNLETVYTSNLHAERCLASAVEHLKNTNKSSIDKREK